MELINLSMFPEKVKNIIEPYLSNMVDVMKGNIASIFAYGSVTGPDYIHGKSDINLAFVLTDNSIKVLKPSMKILKAGLKNKITIPVFMTPGYIKMSLDTFPIEFLEMKETRVLLFGKDILADIKVNKEDIRRECESQVKGKALTIRQVYLENVLNRKALEKLLKGSLKSLFPVFRSLLRLKDIPVTHKSKMEVLSELSETFDMDITSFIEVLKDTKSDGKIGAKDADYFVDAFLIELGRLSNVIDELEV